MLLDISEGQVTETGQAKMPSDVACLDITPSALVSQSSLIPCITAIIGQLQVICAQA